MNLLVCLFCSCSLRSITFLVLCERLSHFRLERKVMSRLQKHALYPLVLTCMLFHLKHSLTPHLCMVSSLPHRLNHTDSPSTQSLHNHCGQEQIVSCSQPFDLLCISSKTTLLLAKGKVLE